MSVNQTALVGWQGDCNSRGTYSILQSCLGTVVLLCWSSVCPNVPALDGGARSKIRGKLTLFLLAILMPEAVLYVALGQLHKAWVDRKAFAKRQPSSSISSPTTTYTSDSSTSSSSKLRSWGLRQCFFVNMGGLCIQFRAAPSLEGNQPQKQPRPFPVNCTQLRHLADAGFLELPVIPPEEIEMRTKANGLSRTITILQVLWFTITTLARTAQGLPITTLELTTLSMVLIMVVSAVVWWRKPMDISHPMIVECDVPLSVVLAATRDPPNAAARSRSFGATPLSFYDRQEWLISKMWASYMNILRALCGGAKSPIARSEEGSFPNAFSSVELAPTALGLEAFAGLLTQAYCCVLIAAWNSYFPTRTEEMLWRASTVAGVSFGYLGCSFAFLDRYGENMGQGLRDLWRWLRKMTGHRVSAVRQAAVPRSTSLIEKKISKTRSWCDCLPLRSLSNLSQGRDPSLDLPLRVWIPATLLCMAYCFARAFVIIEDIISLRRQPPSTYEVVSWGQYGLLF